MDQSGLNDRRFSISTLIEREKKSNALSSLTQTIQAQYRCDVPHLGRGGESVAVFPWCHLSAALLSAATLLLFKCLWYLIKAFK